MITETHSWQSLNSNTSPRTEERSPERNLVASIIAHAFQDLKESRSQEERGKALNFIMGHGVYKQKRYREHPFSFECCCELLDFSVEEMRRIAMEMYRNPAEFDFS